MADSVNVSIVEHFRTLEDPRIERTKKHNLLDILVIALCTLLTGGERFQDMELFGKSKRSWLQTFLALPHGIPSHDTFGRVFARLHPKRFQECFLSWTQAHCVRPSASPSYSVCTSPLACTSPRCPSPSTRHARRAKRWRDRGVATYPSCHRGALRLIAVMTQGKVIRTIRRPLKLAADPPPLAPARARQATCDWVA
jgi:hypothetical protein